MRTIEDTLDRLLELGASDLLLSCGSPARMRKDGRVLSIHVDQEPS